MILCRDIDDQRILQSDQVRGTTSGTQPKGIVLMQKSKTSFNWFRGYWWSKSASVGLIESILGYNWKPRFFTGMQISQNHKKHYCILFLLPKKTHQWIKFSAKENFWFFPQNETFSEKFGSVHFSLLRPSDFI